MPEIFGVDEAHDALLLLLDICLRQDSFSVSLLVATNETSISHGYKPKGFLI